MAEGWGPTAGNAAITTVAGAYVNMQLHTAAPGAAGATAIATETSRKAVTWGTASNGSIASVTNTVTWTGIAGSQDATHFTMWSVITAGTGTFGFSGTITANPYTAGDSLSFAPGSIVASVPLAS
jgi:hypothetical protein